MLGISLPERIDYAILAIVFRSEHEKYECDWRDWEIEIRVLVEDYSNPRDLLAAFKRLWYGGMIHLTRLDEQAHILDYSGDDAGDEEFFQTGPFTVIGTPAGGSCWDGIRMRWQSRSTGSA